MAVGHRRISRSLLGRMGVGVAEVAEIPSPSLSALACARAAGRTQMGPVHSTPPARRGRC